MIEHCFYCESSENSFAHPDYNCKWVRIALTCTACLYIQIHVATYMCSYMYVPAYATRGVIYGLRMSYQKTLRISITVLNVNAVTIQNL